MSRLPLLPTILRRRLAVLVPSLVTLLTPVACGGGTGTGDGTKAPSSVSSAPSSASATDATAPAASAGSTTTTTTTTLGEGGDLQGAKLGSTTQVASTTSSAAPPGKGPHTHEIGRTPADLRAIMVAHRDEARACYDAAAPSHPGVQGDLVIQFTIDPKGNVTQISQDASRSQITEPTIVACVVGIIKKIQFAASPGGYETKAFFPYNFLPRHGTTPPPG